MWDCVTGKQIENNFGCIMADEMVCEREGRREKGGEGGWKGGGEGGEATVLISY